MTNHCTPPQARRVEIGVVRFSPDCRRIEQDVRSHEHHRAGCFGIPLIPADTDAELCTMRALPHLEARVPGAEVEFLLIARTVGDMALAVNPGDRAVGADHCERIIMVRAIELEKARRNPDLELGGEFLHRNDRGMLGGGLRRGEEALVFDPAKIGSFEQLGGQNHFRPLCSTFAHELANRSDIGIRVFAKGKLEGSDRKLCHAGTCCEMQWKLPPPVRMWLARRPVTTRSGKRAWSTSTAARSFATP